MFAGLGSRKPSSQGQSNFNALVVIVMLHNLLMLQAFLAFRKLRFLGLGFCGVPEAMAVLHFCSPVSH